MNIVTVSFEAAAAEAAAVSLPEAFGVFTLSEQEELCIKQPLGSQSKNCFNALFQSLHTSPVLFTTWFSIPFCAKLPFTSFSARLPFIDVLAFPDCVCRTTRFWIDGRRTLIFDVAVGGDALNLFISLLIRIRRLLVSFNLVALAVSVATPDDSAASELDDSSLRLIDAAVRFPGWEQPSAMDSLLQQSLAAGGFSINEDKPLRLL